MTMKKRIFSLLLALVMALGLCVTTAWAEEETVRELRQSAIDNGTYGQVGSHEISGGSYRLMENISLTQVLQILKNNIVTIDLNGYTLSLKDGVQKEVLYVAGATLILKDSSAAQTGTVTGGTGYNTSYLSTNLCGGGVYVDENAAFRMYGGTITNCTATQSGSAVYLYESATMTASGGTVNGELYVSDGSTITGAVQGDVTVAKPDDSETAYYAVTFNSNGGSAVANQTVFGADAKAVKPADPTRAGYTFAGWLNEDGSEYDFEAAVAGNLTLTAKWEELPPQPSKPATTPATTTDTTVVSAPKTGDVSMTLYGALALTSLLGMGYVGKKR